VNVRGPLVRMTSVLVAVAAALICAPTLAYAQADGPSRPFRVVFGGAGAGRVLHHVLDVTTSVAGGYDDNVLADVGGVLPGAQVSGNYFTFLPAARYGWQGTRVQIGASGASALRQYGTLGVRTFSHTGAVGLTARVGGRTTVFVNQAAAYSPSYLLGLFPPGAAPTPGEAIPAGLDAAATQVNALSYGTSASITHDVSRRSALSLTGDFSRTDFTGGSLAQRDTTSSDIGGRFSRRVARNWMFSAGYGYRSGTLGSQTGGSASEQLVEFGVDHDRPVSATRRAFFGVSVGTSVLRAVSALDDAPAAERRYHLVSGEARAGYQFGRSWQARGTYQRGLEYVAGLDVPVLRDGVSAELDGALTRRVEFLAAARYASGGSAVSAATSTFTSYMTDVQIRRAFTHGVAAYAEYSYYYYDFRGTTLLAPGVPPTVARNGVRAGLSVWIRPVGR
jgi:hypothetical protein